MVLFLGKEKLPDEITKLYHEFINGWSMMPFWSLGYHQSRFGVKNLTDFMDIARKFEEVDLPLDSKSIKWFYLISHYISLLERHRLHG